MKGRYIIPFVIFVLISCQHRDTEKQIQFALDQSYENPPKVKFFNHTEALIKRLSDKSSLFFTTWQKVKFTNGIEKWSSHTALEQFGGFSETGLQNDIGYILLGLEKPYCNELRIVLNIKNVHESTKALSTLSIWTQQTFGKLEMDIPEGLIAGILDGKPLFFENESSFILLQKTDNTEVINSMHHKEVQKKTSTFDSWKLIIKSK